MAEESPLLNNNSNQQPPHSLSLSPILPASINEGPVDGSKETRFPERQTLSRSPKKKSKWSDNPKPILQEVERTKETEIPPETEGFCVAGEAATGISGGDRDFVQVSDEFDGRNGSASLESEIKKHDFERNEAVVQLKDEIRVVEEENFSKFQELGASCEKCSLKQSVEFELGNKNGNIERNGSRIGEVVELDGGVRMENETFETMLNVDPNCEVVQFDSEKSVNCDAVTCSLKAEVIEGAGVVDERKDRKGDLSSVNVASGALNGGGRKFVYSRKEMEVLRFVNVKAQKKFWQAIHNGLEKTVKREYDELSNFKHQKYVNRHQTTEMRSYNGESSLEDVSCDTEIISSVDLTRSDDNSGKGVKDLVGEWTEQEESDDEYGSIQRPAFLVEGEPDFESGPPEDGLEYLRRVRWEATHIPKVKVAKIDNSKLKKEQSVYMPKIPDIEKCPPHLAPSKQWEDEFIVDFSELRLAVASLEDTNDTTPTGPQSIIFGPREHKSHSSKSRAYLELPTGGPTLSTVLGMDPATRVTLLKRRITLFEKSSNLSKDDCAWLFALCAAVDTPLDADTCASLRCLLRRCAKLRAGKSELDDEAVMLNVLATISGKFFGQLEK